MYRYDEDETVYRYDGQPYASRPYGNLQAGLEQLLAFVESQEQSIEVGDELRALIEAEFLLSGHWYDRHGCGCGRHL